MALCQTEQVRERLIAANPALAAADTIELVRIRTTGDQVQDRPLADIGGKGLFAKEIDMALLDGRIDLAVHSLKDLETWLPAGIEIACILPRDDPRDALLARKAASLLELPAGAIVGTASLRRQAQLLRQRPDLRIVPIRGNAETRIRKLVAGEVDATLLALCGLQRIGLAHLATEVLSRDLMLPAVGQGAIAVECRTADDQIKQLLAPLHDKPSAACAAAERALLAAPDGSGHTPIAALAEIFGDRLTIDGLLLTPDASAEIRQQLSGPIADAAALGRALGEELRRNGGPRFGLE